MYLSSIVRLRLSVILQLFLHFSFVKPAIGRFLAFPTLYLIGLVNLERAGHYSNYHVIFAYFDVI